MSLKFLILSLFFMSAVYANESCLQDEVESYQPISSVCVRGGAYIHTSNRYHEIYGRWGSVYQIEMTTESINCFQAWGNIDWSTKEGRSDSLQNWTRISLLNLSAGLKYPYALSDSFTAYVGLGPSIGTVWVRNHFPSNQLSSDYKHENKLTLGFVVKSGLIYNISCQFYIDLFLDYHFLATKFRSYTDLSGFKTGVGLGYRF